MGLFNKSRKNVHSGTANQTEVPPPYSATVLVLEKYFGMGLGTPPLIAAIRAWQAFCRDSVLESRRLMETLPHMVSVPIDEIETVKSYFQAKGFNVRVEEPDFLPQGRRVERKMASHIILY